MDEFLIITDAPIEPDPFDEAQIKKALRGYTVKG